MILGNHAFTSSTTSSIQFSIAYGNSIGSGSAPLNPLVVQNTPTRINFGQYRNLIYGDAESNINFGTGNTASIDLIALPVDRNRYKESLFPGTWNLYLSGSAGLVKLTDNSNDVTTITYVDGGRVYYIVSGSNGTAANSPLVSGASQKGFTPSGSYGLFLPDIGLFVLNPLALANNTAGGGIGLSLSTGNTNTAASQNYTNIVTSIIQGANFQLNSQETISLTIPRSGGFYFKYGDRSIS